MPGNLRGSIPLRQLRGKVIETIRAHWVTPRASSPIEPVPTDQVDKLAGSALDTLLTRQFRVGKRPSGFVYEQLLRRVRRRVSSGLPIRVSLGYAPLKNQNAVNYNRADWADFFALCHLAAWHNKLAAVYPPGLEIALIFDDVTLAFANQADKEFMYKYVTSMRELIAALGFEKLIVRTLRHTYFAWLFHLGFYQVAAWRVRRWEQEPGNRGQLERMDEFARRNLTFPANLPPQERERRVRLASHRYRVYWEALQLSGLTRLGSSLVAMYLDGTQHHIRQAVALHLTSVDKGQVTQPWQGQGVLLDNGHGKLEPFVLTSGRRPRYQTVEIANLDLLPLRGFDRILVAIAKQERQPGGQPAAQRDRRLV